jgi:hypothetical protein
MVKSEFPGVKLCINPRSEEKVYTLALNWNNAAKHTSGTRLIFTNADCIFPSGYVTAHADPVMQNDIIFGPNERTDEAIGLMKHFSDALNQQISVVLKDEDLKEEAAKLQRSIAVWVNMLPDKRKDVLAFMKQATSKWNRMK